MINKSRLGKVAGVALAAAVIAVAGLGAGAVSADDGSSGGRPRPQQLRNDDRPGPGPQQGGPMQGARIGPGGPTQQGGPNGNRPGQQQAPRPGQAAPNAANNQAAVRARGIIIASAEVMAVTPETVLAGLNQGQTLTQVAAAHGLARDYFLSELVSQISKDIADGQRFGIPASANLNAHLASVIDDVGLGMRGVGLSGPGR